MGEQSLARRIVQLAERCACQVRARPDEGCCYLVIGFRGAPGGEPKWIGWDIVSRGGLAEEARRHFERALTQLRCAQCGCLFDLTETAPVCPACGSASLKVADASAEPLGAVLDAP